MNLADILKDIGNEGRFQVLALLTLAMPKIPLQWSMTMMSYAAYEPEWCCVPKGIKVDGSCELELFKQSNFTRLSFKFTYGRCDLNSTICSRRVYVPSDGATTAVTEWDLVCDQQWIVSSLSSIQMAGVMVGSFISGFFSDVFGRKKVHFSAILLHTLLNIGAGFSVSWQMFAVFRFFIGLAIGAYLVAHVPYILEFVSPKWRVVPASIPFAALGASLLPLAAWQLPDWRWLHFICAIMSAPFLLGYLFLPESVRWLTVKGKVEDAAKVADQIARINKMEYDPAKCLKKIQKVADRERETKDKGRKYSYLDVYRGWKMARLTLTLQFVWFTTSLVGYGIILGISDLAGNVYLNMFLVEAVEIPFIMGTYYFSNCIGRRYTAFTYFSLGTLTALGAFIFHLLPGIPGRDVAITVMCICCRTFVAAAGAVFIVVSTEVYPTVIRTLGYGAANTAAKVGGVLAPFIINMDSIPTVAYAVMFGTCLLCVGAVLSLSETKNMMMEDTLEKASSKFSIMSSLSNSLDQKPTPRRSSSVARVIIDLDTDLIHHRSYSEFDDENDGENEAPFDDEVRDMEKSPLIRQQQQQMYDPALASRGQYGGEFDMEKIKFGNSVDNVYESTNQFDKVKVNRSSNINKAFDGHEDLSSHQKQQSYDQRTDTTVEKMSGTDMQGKRSANGSSIIRNNIDSPNTVKDNTDSHLPAVGGEINHKRGKIHVNRKFQHEYKKSDNTSFK